DAPDPRTARAVRHRHVRNSASGGIARTNTGSHARVRGLHAAGNRRARIHPERAIRISARFGIRVVPRSLRARQHPPEPLTIPTLADDGAFAVPLALAACATLVPPRQRPSADIGLDRLWIYGCGHCGLPAICL